MTCPPSAALWLSWSLHEWVGHSAPASRPLGESWPVKTTVQYIGCWRDLWNALTSTGGWLPCLSAGYFIWFGSQVILFFLFFLYTSLSTTTAYKMFYMTSKNWSSGLAEHPALLCLAAAKVRSASLHNYQLSTGLPMIIRLLIGKATSTTLRKKTQCYHQGHHMLCPPVDNHVIQVTGAQRMCICFTEQMTTMSFHRSPT